MMDERKSQTVALCAVLALAVLAQGAYGSAEEKKPTATAAGIDGGAPVLRFRRHASGPAKQLLEGDEQVLRRQLPDLIAQAHQDKTVERALLKMLISASLRQGLSNMAASPQQQLASGNNWQVDNDNTLTQYSQVGEEFVPIRAARNMEQVVPSGGAYGGDFASLDGSDLSSLTASIQQLNGRLAPLLEQQAQQQQQQAQAQQFPLMDKREYIKPCSFNAISCVRRPFGVNK